MLLTAKSRDVDENSVAAKRNRLRLQIAHGKPPSKRNDVGQREKQVYYISYGKVGVAAQQKFEK